MPNTHHDISRISQELRIGRGSCGSEIFWYYSPSYAVSRRIHYTLEADAPITLPNRRCATEKLVFPNMYRAIQAERCIVFYLMALPP